MSLSDSEMTFWEHLGQLRQVLLRIALLLSVIAVASFIYMPDIFDRVILAPCRSDFPLYRGLDWLARQFPGAVELLPDFNLKLVSLQLASQFMIHITAACWLSVVIGFPWIVYMLWGFVAPGLHEHEKRGIRRAFVWSNLMFFAGVATGYYVVFPITVRFLADYSLSSQIDALVSLDSYMDNFFSMLLLMGIVFELPLLAWLLGRAGILTRGFFSRYRRHAVFILLIVAAIITPTGDPFSLAAVFLPIYFLWELSSRLVPAG